MATTEQRSDDAAECLETAARLAEVGDVATALEHLSGVLAADAARAGEVAELMARCALERGELAEAGDLLSQADSAAPAHLRWRIQCTRAECLRRYGRLDEPEILFRKVFAASRQTDPKTAARALLGRAEIASSRGRVADAAAHLRTAAKLDGRSAPIAVRLAEILSSLGERKEALAAVDRAMRLDLGPGPLLGRIARVLDRLDKGEQAEAAASIALRLNPDDRNALSVAGRRLLARHHAGAALAYFERLSRLSPDATTLCNLGVCHFEQARPAEAAALLARAVALAPKNKIAVSDLLMIRHSDPDSDPDMAAEEARRLASACYTVPSASMIVPRPRDTDPRRRLRVGYVSADFCMHPVAFFLEAILKAHDPAAVETVLYSATGKRDQVTARLMHVAGDWREIADMGDDDLARLVVDDEIDILVDLSGHTKGNRLGAFARKPAPVQVTWLGYFGTTGLETMDYIIADPIVLPPEHEHRFTEAPMRLPTGYLCFTAPDGAPDVVPPPCGDDRAVTFGCLNKLPKLNERVVALWAEVLAEVPGARLALRSRQLGDPAARERLLGMFTARGVSADRLVIDLPGQRTEFLAAYNEIDIALDPFPFSGGTTTAEALWMGVPVVTLRGDRFSARVSESILTTIGLTGLVADDVGAYVRIAGELARDRARLAELRRTMRARMTGSPFMNAAIFARHLEAAYRKMWEEHCRRIREREAA